MPLRLPACGYCIRGGWYPDRGSGKLKPCCCAQSIPAVAESDAATANQANKIGDEEWIKINRGRANRTLGGARSQELTAAATAARAPAVAIGAASNGVRVGVPES